jgi:hypothetical protein
MKTFPDFGKELRRPFEVDARCYDCAEFYHGCNARPENPDARCGDRLRLPDVMPGTCGQTLPPSRMQGRTEPRIRLAAAAPVQVEVQPKNPPASRLASSAQPQARLCGCGAILPKGRRLCDQCQTQNRRQTKRDYMRTYMEQRRSVEVGFGSHVPFPATGTHATQAGGGDLRASGLWEGGASLDQTSVLTESVP